MTHLIENLYVLPDAGKQIAARARAKFSSGAYDSVTSPAQFAEALTRDLREIGKDKHLYVRYDPSAAGTPVVTTAEWDSQLRRNRAERAARRGDDDEGR
ncbi:MAG: hypothetical protein LC746_07990, partial [Acidobacteria bacterium]|nr:hypothetical protein [Acidobacteriota bacterium]